MRSVAARGRDTFVYDMGAWFDVSAGTSPKKEWAPVGVVCAGKEAGFATGKIRCFPIPIGKAQHGGLGEAARRRPDTASKTRDTGTRRCGEHKYGSRWKRRGRRAKNRTLYGLFGHVILS
ncbi:hypothetical protein Q7C36_018459 [Tachysurus vachellii]|uniref:Uncharacterized protein n=1 Tax=Tachysurus vachellii TaxID=175792 RepID=A0AA88SAR1_TACVA|nr:hypothetical protein Q7C36_018459 [Tachysurus vachellii]